MLHFVSQGNQSNPEIKSRFITFSFHRIDRDLWLQLSETAVNTKKIVYKYTRT